MSQGHKVYSRLGITSIKNPVPDYAGSEGAMYFPEADTPPSTPITVGGGVLYLKDKKFYFHDTSDYLLNNPFIQVNSEEIQNEDKLSRPERSIIIGKFHKLSQPYNIIIGFEDPTESSPVSVYNGDASIIMGKDAGRHLEDGNFHIIIGHRAGKYIKNGESNIIIGDEAGCKCDEGTNLIVLGARALKDSSIIGEIIAIGTCAMGNAGKTEYNIAIGLEALYDITDNYNIGLGVNAGKGLIGPLVNQNIIIGKEAMKDSNVSSMNNIAMGTSAGSNMKGSVFQTIIIGEHAGYSMESDIITVNTIILGSETGSYANNLSDVIIMGAMSGKNITGTGFSVIGSNSGLNTKGSLGYDIIVGFEAGNFREYSNTTDHESAHIFIGYKAGTNLSENSDVKKYLRSIGIGAQSLFNSKSEYTVCVGDKSGMNSSGGYNIYLGPNAGMNVRGNNNFIASPSNYQDNEIIDISGCILLGDSVSRQGLYSCVMGHQAGYEAKGVLNHDILIGHCAGSGVYLSNSRESSDRRNILAIGSSAMKGKMENIQKQPSNVIAIGNDAGNSDEQDYHETVFVGHNAGSYAKSVSYTVVVGHNAGIGMCGSRNTYLGAHAGFNVLGDDNILIGPFMGDNNIPNMNDTFMLGVKENILLYGNIKSGSLCIAPSPDKLPVLSSDRSLWLNESSARTNTFPSYGSEIYTYQDILYLASEKHLETLNIPFSHSKTGKIPENGRLVELKCLVPYYIEIKLIGKHPYQRSFFFDGTRIINSGVPVDEADVYSLVMRDKVLIMSDLNQTNKDPVCINISITPVSLDKCYILDWKLI